MRLHLLNSAFAVSTGLLLCIPASTTPVAARGNGIGIGLGVGSAIILLDQAARAVKNGSGGGGGGGSHRNRRHEKNDDDDGDSDSGANTKSNAKSDAANARAAEKYELGIRILQNELAESKRNVEWAITSFIDTLAEQHKKLRSNDSSVRVGNTINQVTAGEVRRLLEDEYAKAELSRFDRFAGELWTRDRLLVEVLNEAKTGLKPYFEGVGAKGPSIDDLKAVLHTAAAEVYSRALETSEIIGVSYSFDRFVRTIYENSDRVPPKLLTFGADGRYERMLTKAINTVPAEKFVAASSTASYDPLGMKRQFQYRFRARRSYYDCLSANYMEIATGQREEQSTIPVGLVKIDTLQTTASKDGVKAAVAKSSRAEIQPAAETGSTAAEVWGRVQEHVNEKCKLAVVTLAEEVRAKGLEPQPARWDSLTPFGGGASAPGLQPIINIQVPAVGR